MKKGFIVFAIAFCLMLSGCESEEREEVIREAYNYGYDQGYEDGRYKAREEIFSEVYQELDKVQSKIGDKEDLLENYRLGYITIEDVAELLDEIGNDLYGIMEK